MNALDYFFTASLYLLLFYGCYWLFLRRNTFFGLNRGYLLVSVGLSFALPLVELPGGTTDALSGGTITLPTFVVNAGTTAQTNDFAVDRWFWLVYGLGVLVMLGRLAMNGRAVRQLIAGGIAEPRREYTLVRLPNDNVPSFSFGRYLVLNQTDAQTEPDALICHEEAHIRQRHTIDILFIELVRAAIWFNPMLILYKRRLQEVHEFLADEAVTQTAPRPDYARQLVAYALNVPSATLATPFVSISTLKQRIIMLQKPTSSRRALLGYALVLPLAGLLTLCTQPDSDVAQTNQSARRTHVDRSKVVDDEIFTVVEEQPRFKGGMEGLGPYLSQNLKYPEAAEKAKAEGRVFVSFIVTKDGDVTDVKILKGIGFGADEEAVRVVSNMPRWEPGRQNNRAVNVKYNLPINFQMEENKDSQGDGLDGMKHFLINGKESTKEALMAFPPSKIIRMDVNKEGGTVSITTKE